MTKFQWILSWLVGATFLIFGSIGTAFAQTTTQATGPTPTPTPSPSPLVGCALQFSVHIEALGFESRGTGKGIVLCSDASGQKVSGSPVKVEIHGIGPGLGIFDLSGFVANVGIFNPSDIAGTYTVIESAGGVGKTSAGTLLGFEDHTSGLSFTASVNVGKGLGAFVNASRWKISVPNP